MKNFNTVECNENHYAFHSLEANVVARRWEELKNKLREDLRNEIRAISGGGDGGSKAPRQSNAEGRKKAPDSTDYFELVYECLYTRPNFLNIISLNSRNPVEPDIDLVILQALLNGKEVNIEKTEFHKFLLNSLSSNIGWKLL